MTTQTVKIGFIGCGNMAKAILAGVLEKKGITSDQIALYDTYKEAAQQVANATGAIQKNSLEELIESSDVLLIAVKPNVVPHLFDAVHTELKNKAIISIAAGVTMNQLQAYTKNQARILRVMPNTPAMVSEGATILCDNTDFNENEKIFAESLFQAIGLTLWLPEKQIDGVTGVSGSGPAYAYLFIEAMADGGVRAGLPRDIAQKLAAQTLLGAAKMVLESGLHPGVLKDMVCSPGGTTIDAVHALESGNFRATVMNAVQVATEKSKELSKQ